MSSPDRQNSARFQTQPVAAELLQALDQHRRTIRFAAAPALTLAALGIWLTFALQDIAPLAALLLLLPLAAIVGVFFVGWLLVAAVAVATPPRLLWLVQAMNFTKLPVPAPAMAGWLVASLERPPRQQALPGR